MARTQTVAGDPGAIADDPQALLWEDVARHLDGDSPPDFTFLDSGPLALPGVELPLHLLDFKWGRVSKASGEADVSNIRSNEETGWRPVPHDMVPIARHLARNNSLQGGVSVAGMQLMMRSKRASEKVRGVLNEMSERLLDDVVVQYDQKVGSKAGMLSTQMPKATFDRHHEAREYRGREAVAQMDDD